MYTVPTLDELHQLLVDLAAALLPGIDVSRASFPGLFAKVMAAAATDNHAAIVAARADLMLTTAEGAALDAWGELLGKARRGATGARKADGLRLVNTTGSGVAYTSGAELTHSSGLRFQLAESGTVLASAAKDVDVAAIDTGARTRLEAGEVLQFTAPIAGIEELAVLVLDLDQDGNDAELDGPYRDRLLARLRTPPRGGAANDYVTWAIESSPLIATAYCYPNRAGLGTVDVVALYGGSGSERLLDAGARTALLAYLNQRRPTGATVRVLEVLEQPVSSEVLARETGEEAYAWDWDDATAPVVLSWNSVTRTLTFTVDRPASMQAGHRLVVAAAALTGKAEILTIESLSGTAAVVLEAAPTVAPVAADVVYAAGPLSVAVRAAIVALIDQLGPANPAADPYGDWDGSLRPAALYGVAGDQDGVRDVSVVTPAAVIDATDPPVPDDLQVYLLTPGRTLVRRYW